MAVLELNALSVDLSGSFSATVFFPENRAAAENKKYPALFFLHDIGGDDTDIRTVKGLEALASELGLYIVAPALNHSFGLDLEWGAKYGHFVNTELPGICAHMFPIDKSRLYVGGVGGGAWGAVMQAAEHPDVFEKCIAIDGKYDIASLCEAALAGAVLPNMSVANLEALFAPLDQVRGGRFDILAPGHVMPKQLYLACLDTDIADTAAVGKAAGVDVHTASTEMAMYSGAVRWLMA